MTSWSVTRWLNEGEQVGERLDRAGREGRDGRDGEGWEGGIVGGYSLTCEVGSYERNNVKFQPFCAHSNLTSNHTPNFIAYYYCPIVLQWSGKVMTSQKLFS